MSADLYWEITRSNSSYLVKRGSGSGRVVFSKEPLNLTNKHSRKYSGLVNEKAIGVQPSANGGVALISKTDSTKNGSKPAKLFNHVDFSKNKSNRKTFLAVANTSKNYRDDLRQDAVARASAVLKTSRPKKATPERKPRGAKAARVAEKV